MGSTPVTRSGAGFDLELLDSRPGVATLRVSGRGAARAFAQESGGLRFQRVPPTERKGRVHTSTITVSVLPEQAAVAVEIPEEDLLWRVCRSGGKGGQHVNKTSSAVQLTHKPTGLAVRVESRSQLQNRAQALALLRAKLLSGAERAAEEARNAQRRADVGSGMRGDKRRTIAVQRDEVFDHETGRRTTWRRYERGYLEDLQ